MEKLADLARNVDKVNSSIESGDPVRIHQAIKHAFPQKQRMQCAVIGDDGTPALTYAHHKQIFRDYFSQLMSADIVSFESLIECQRKSYSSPSSSDGVPMDPGAFLSVPDLCRDFAKLEPKGVGENRLG
eukprot:8504455-Karenia_brevis.AAC.1